MKARILRADIAKLDPYVARGEYETKASGCDLHRVTLEIACDGAFIRNLFDLMRARPEDYGMPRARLPASSGEED